MRLGVLAVLARLLSPEDFGLVAIALIFVNFSSVFSQLGVGPAIVQRHDLSEGHLRAGFTLSILMGALFALILVAFAPLITQFFREPGLGAVIYGISPCFFLAGLGIVAESLLERELDFKRLMWIEVGSFGLGYAPVGVAFAVLDYGVWALVAALLAQSSLKSVLAFVLRPHPVMPLLRRQELQELLRFGGGFTLAQLFNLGATQGDSIVVGRVLDAAALGIYSRAYQLMMLPSAYFATVLQKVMFPVMAKVQGQLKRMNDLFLVSMSGVSLVSAPLSALMVICAPEIVAVLLGPQWTAVVLPFQILSLGTLFRTGYKMGDSVALATGTVYRRSLRELAYASAVIVGGWSGAHRGLAGVAVAVLLAITLNYILVVVMSKQILSFSWREFLSSQSPGVLLALLVALVAGPTRYLLVSADMPSIPRLGLTLVITLAFLAAVIWLKPTIVGRRGRIILSTLYQYLPARVHSMPVVEWILRRSRYSDGQKLV
jgi:PST family polysaccharide transporter